jgi:SAM-dependent methyltransferase
MHGLGFHDILATDLCPKMVQEFRRICRLLELSIPSKVVDATAIPFEDNIFDGVIFGFNGLMQIPGAANRQRAIHEVYRVLRPGHFFVFTTHDRDHWKFKDYWKKEQLRWRKGQQQLELIDFGDMVLDDALGKLFLHVPTVREVIDMLKSVGFMVEANMMRSQLANEPLKVREFADDCRFWVAMKPSGG